MKTAKPTTVRNIPKLRTYSPWASPLSNGARWQRRRLEASQKLNNLIFELNSPSRTITLVGAVGKMSS